MALLLVLWLNSRAQQIAYILAHFNPQQIVYIAHQLVAEMRYPTDILLVKYVDYPGSLGPVGCRLIDLHG